MAINFAGNVYDDSGVAIQGATVQLIGSDGVQEGTADTTDSNGAWNFSESDQDQYDIKITRGSSIRYIRWADQISLKEIDVRNNTGATTPAATFTNLQNSTSNQVAVFSGANTTRADGDVIYLSYKLANAAGELTEFARMIVEAEDTHDGSEDGAIRFQVMRDGTLATVWEVKSTGDGDVDAPTMSFDLNMDSLSIGNGADTDIVLTFDANTADGVITWMEDEDYFKFSDDILMNSTEKIQFYDTGLYIYSSTDGQLDIVADTEVQIAATTVDLNGNLDVSGTYTGGGLMTTGGNIVIPNAGNIGSASDTDAIAISSGGVVTMNQIPVFSAGINVSGGTIAGTLATAAQGNVTSLGTLTTLTIDNVILNGTTIGHTSDTDLITLADGNVTIAGELDLTTLDVSGNADIDGTLEADAITIDGTTLAEYIADTVGAMVTSNTESGITVAYQDGDNTLDFTVGTLNQDTTGTAAIATTVTITDNENTNENNAIVFTSGGDLDGGNIGLESDGDLYYNPSTGTLTVTNVSVSGTFSTVNSVTMNANNAVVFEGTTADAYETTLTSVDATADRTISLPNVGGTLPVLAAASTTQITATPDEINLIDGGTARGTTAIADGDGVLINDDGTMRMTTVQTLAAYLDDEITAMPNLVTVGTIGTGVWQGTAIASGYIAADAITGAKIADDAIDSEHYTDGSIDLAHMSSESVDEDNLYISNSGSDGQFLSKQSGNNGGLTWATPSSTATAADDIADGDGAVNILTTSGNITIDAQANDADVIIKVDDNGSAVTAVTFDGSDEGNAIFVNDVQLKSDGALLEFGADLDTTLTHTDGAGLTLNSTNKLMFNDASQFIQGASATVLDIAATDEIELTATLIDVVGNFANSGTITSAGIIKTNDTTNATSTTDGSLQTDGGLSVVLDAVFGDDVTLITDSAVLNLGVGSDVSITHDGTTGGTITGTPMVYEAKGAASLANDTHAGIVLEFLAGESIAVGQLVYMSTVDGRVSLADANDTGDGGHYPAIGVAVSAQGSAGSAVKILTHGTFNDSDGFGGDLTEGQVLYLSETAGGFTNTAPSDDGDMVQVVGIAIGPRDVFINPSLDVIEHA